MLKINNDFIVKKSTYVTHYRPFSNHVVDMATVVEPSKVGLYLVCFNSQVMKQIVYFCDFNVTWEYKISLNFTICY